MKSKRAPRFGQKSRTTEYVIHLIVENDDDSGGDPYARTKYKYPSESFTDRKAAERAFRYFKKTKLYNGYDRIVRAHLERKTITPLAEF